MLFRSGIIGIVKDGDIIDIDINACSINLRVPEEEINERLKNFKPNIRPVNGYLSRYRNLVTSAAKGAVWKK